MAVFVLRGVPVVDVSGRPGYEDVDPGTLGPDVPGTWGMSLLEDLGAAMSIAVECEPTEMSSYLSTRLSLRNGRALHAKGAQLIGQGRKDLLHATLGRLR